MVNNVYGNLNPEDLETRELKYYLLKVSKKPKFRGLFFKQVMEEKNEFKVTSYYLFGFIRIYRSLEAKTDFTIQ